MIAYSGVWSGAGPDPIYKWLRNRQFQPLVRQLQLFESDLRAARIQIRAGPLARPGIAQPPDEDRVVGLIQKDDCDPAAVHFAAQTAIDPVPERKVASQSALKRDIRDFIE